MIRRGLRLQLFAASAVALAMLTGPIQSIAQTAPRQSSQTTLVVETHDHSGRTQAVSSVTVLGDDGLPAAGAVTIADTDGRALAGAALDAQGHAGLTISLPEGPHSLQAVYSGDGNHAASVSDAARVHAQSGTTPNFSVSVAPATLSLTPGESGTVIASVTPENSSGLSAPMFVTLSCSGLPDYSACTFTPETVEILPNATAALTSSMVVTTQQASASIRRSNSIRGNAISWAVLLPGALGLGGLAWSFRRCRWLQRMSLLALLAFVTVLGTTGCNPRYNFEHHGPPPNPATPAGTYTVTVTAQSSDGVTAITNPTTFALTVQ
jgi:hypothetical protein